MKVLNNKVFLNTGILVIIILLITGCANNEPVGACVSGIQYGFWGGLWHGIIAPVDFVISLFRSDFTVFAPNNNGAWYAFGFIIGSGGWGFFGGKGVSRRRKRKPDYQ